MEKTIRIMEKTIGPVTFSYTEMGRVGVSDQLWYGIYYDAVLETGEKVDQISVEYNLETIPEDGKISLSIHFENKEGDVHHLSPDTCVHLNDRMLSCLNM